MGIITNNLGFAKKAVDPLGIFSQPQAPQMNYEQELKFTDPNYAQNKARVEAERQRIQNAGNLAINQAPQNDLRNQQLQLAQSMQARAAGQAPSAAELQMQRGMDANIAAQRAMAASQRGVNSGLTARNLAQGMAQANRQTVNDTALLRAQEQAQAEANLAGLLSGTREQDIGLATDSAKQELAREALVQSYLNMGLSVDQAQFQAQQDLVKTQMGLSSGAYDAASQQRAAGLQTAGTVAAALMAASDKNQKKKVAASERSVEDFLSTLAPKEFEYKNPDIEGAAPGKRFGILAQDLEKSPMGKSLVRDTDDGKKVDVAQGLGATLASLGNIDERLKRLEKKKG